MRVQFVAVFFVSFLAYGNSQMFQSFLDSIPGAPKMKTLPNIKKMMPTLPVMKNIGVETAAAAEGFVPSVKMVPLSQVICASILPGLPTPAMCATATTEGTTVATTAAAATTPIPAAAPSAAAAAPPAAAAAPPAAVAAPPAAAASPAAAPAPIKPAA